ncbi:MAG: hypothetical protein LBG58_06540 [Planctomycetaceae bacterium]|nr:hypothetical protein [Planctomycetaceae bacterium]
MENFDGKSDYYRLIRFVYRLYQSCILEEIQVLKRNKIQPVFNNNNFFSVTLT